MSAFKIKHLAAIVALALPPAAMTTPAHAAFAPYAYANSMCPASAPYLIGYAKFTGAPVCTSVCPALACFNLQSSWISYLAPKT